MAPGETMSADTVTQKRRASEKGQRYSMQDCLSRSIAALQKRLQLPTRHTEKHRSSGVAVSCRGNKYFGLTTLGRLTPVSIVRLVRLITSKADQD